jgi:toxin ParE1/3/4
MSFTLSVEAEEDIVAIAAQGVRMFGAGQAKRYHEELSRSDSCHSTHRARTG